MNNSASPRIVIADDDGFFRQILKLIANTAGWEVVAEAADGEQAVACTEQHQPDMLWLDVNMPKMSGMQALAAIHPRAPDLCIVMLTGQDEAGDIEACLTAGASAYVTKGSPNDMGEQLLRIWGERMRP